MQKLEESRRNYNAIVPVAVPPNNTGLEGDAVSVYQRLLDMQKTGATPWQVLNVSRQAGTEDIKRAYRKLSFMVHPDRCKENEANQVFQFLQQSYMQMLSS